MMILLCFVRMDNERSWSLRRVVTKRANSSMMIEYKIFFYYAHKMYSLPGLAGSPSLSAPTGQLGAEQQGELAQL